jgi:hypothetical protein
VALHRRRIHPALAADATRWALTQLADATLSTANIAPFPVESGTQNP